MQANLRTLHNTLRASSYSLTVPRRRIFTIIKQSGPLSMTELVRQCGDSIDRATVYRTAELFSDVGIVNKVWRDNSYSLELSEIFIPHHHHAHCTLCGAQLDLVSSELERALSSATKAQGFLALGHSIELHGYCRSCQ